MNENAKTEVKNAVSDTKNADIRIILERLRGLATDLWDAAEVLEASYGTVLDALNDTCPIDDAMLVLVSTPDSVRRNLEGVREQLQKALGADHVA